MDPFPRPEHQPDENESHEKLTWPWEKAPEDKEEKKKHGIKDEKESKKKPEEPKKEKEEKKEPPKKEEKPEEKVEPEEEKRERRATLVEQSLALVAKYEEEPIPRDASTLAQLMIAHQVIRLNNQLEQPDNEHPFAPEEIEATLDYITQLDEKFKNPNAKVEPAIEQSYQEIMELAEATLAEETDLETVVKNLNLQQNEDGDIQPVSNSYGGSTGKNERNTNKMDTSKQKDPTQDEADRRKHATKETVPAVATASALIYLITHLGRKKPKKEPEQITLGSSDYSPSYSNQSPSANPRPYVQQNYTPNGQLLPSPIDQSLNAPPLRSEHTPTIPSRERVAIPDRQPAPALATAAVATAFAATLSRGETPRAIATSPETYHSSGESTKPEFNTPSQRQATTPENPSAESQRKIEHMPLLQLLSMAENVDIGHGRYLRREFESGHIDKEGLIKILKAHSKGRDYQFEFRQQTSRFTKLKETSPEFLHQTIPNNNQPDEAVEVSAQERNEPIAEPERPDQSSVKPISLAPPTQPDLLPAFASEPHSKQSTSRRLMMIIIGFAAFLTALGFGAFFLYSLLSN